LKLVAERGLVRGERIGVDGSTMEANAALRTIVRRDNGESYRAMLTRMAQESGIETPSAEDMARFDRKRKGKGKTLSNADWKSPTDPEAKIAKMKDGTTHMAYKPEHAVVRLSTPRRILCRVHPPRGTNALSATCSSRPSAGCWPAATVSCSASLLTATWAGASEPSERTTQVFRIDLLPAEFGDAIWMAYGTATARHRILIDCGTSAVHPRRCASASST
jgi:hypothetical protein